jgi:hypothetical protein
MESRKGRTSVSPPKIERNELVLGLMVSDVMGMEGPELTVRADGLARTI